jgi:hypothetical protein
VKQKLIHVQRKVFVVGTFPTDGSYGQFSVHDVSGWSGRRAIVVIAE